MTLFGAALVTFGSALALATLGGCASTQSVHPREVSILGEELRGDHGLLAPPPDEMEMQIHPSRRASADDANAPRKERATLVDRITPEKTSKPPIRDLSAVGSD